MSSRKEPRPQRQRSTTVPLSKKSHPKAIRPLPPEIIITEPVSKQPHPSKRKARPLPPPTHQTFVPVEEVREPKVVAEKPVIAPVRARVSADAGALRGWLTPGTLRSQFILTEILQPPLAMRSERATF